MGRCSARQNAPPIAPGWHGVALRVGRLYQEAKAVAEAPRKFVCASSAGGPNHQAGLRSRHKQRVLELLQQELSPQALYWEWTFDAQDLISSAMLTLCRQR